MIYDFQLYKIISGKNWGNEFILTTRPRHFDIDQYLLCIVSGDQLLDIPNYTMNV